uniref:Syntaphilin n=1 Tax=Cyanistes caeruleus TaxID=156563 RepID=A0A8C0TVC6_CYACU
APSATRPETQPLLPASRRPSPPGRDTYGTSSLSSSSNSGSCKGSDSSPTPRRSSKYNLCSDNHGIKPPTPEQYLTPLQQKEVCIRHLKARLKDTQERLQDRDAEIEDLKTQLSRMQEDWIEEECHRVEAQLALKEARKEIKQLKQVIDTVKNNLLEKDKGLQKYFVDINIQNKKLETLLHSMEVAQNGALKEEGAGESAGGSPARSLTRSSTYTKLSDQGAGDRNVGGSQTISLDEGADSGFVGMEEAPGHTDPLDVGGELGTRLPPSNTYEKVLGLRSCVEAGVQASCMQERAIQTDFVPCQPDLDTILEKVMKSQACSLGSPTSAWVSEMEDTMPVPELANPTGTTDLMVAEPDAAAAAATQPRASPAPHLVNVLQMQPCLAPLVLAQVDLPHTRLDLCPPQPRAVPAQGGDQLAWGGPSGGQCLWGSWGSVGTGGTHSPVHLSLWKCCIPFPGRMRSQRDPRYGMGSQVGQGAASPDTYGAVLGAQVLLDLLAGERQPHVILQLS